MSRDTDRQRSCVVARHVLLLAFALLLSAAVLGGVLAALQLRTERCHHRHERPRRHLGQRGPPRGEALGVGQFGRISAALLAMTVVVAIPIVVVRLRRRDVPGLVIGAHATIAISGMVVLAAYTLVG